MEPGEYCFFYAGATRSERLFDFGSDPDVEAQISHQATAASPRPTSAKFQNARAEEDEFSDEFQLSDSAPKEKPVTAKIVKIKKGFLMIELAKGHSLSPGSEVEVTWFERGSTPGKSGVPAQVVESENRYAILKMRDAKGFASFAVGDKLMVMMIE